MAFSGTYTQGGQNADYTASLPNFGGAGGGPNGLGTLNAQMNAMSNFDPSVMLNAMLQYKAAQQKYAMERADWEHGRNLRETRDAAARSGVNLGSSGGSRGVSQSPTQRFHANRMDMENIQSRDPWAGRGYGQNQGMSMFNFPSASALTYGKDVFPNGFDTANQAMQAAGGTSPGLQRQLGAMQNWGVGF